MRTKLTKNAKNLTILLIIMFGTMDILMVNVEAPNEAMDGLNVSRNEYLNDPIKNKEDQDASNLSFNQGEELDISREQLGMISYDLKTGEESFNLENLTLASSSYLNHTKGYDPFAPLFSPEYVHGDDDRVKVGDTTAFPFRAICQLRMDFDGEYYIGTGALVDDDHVLTCAHNVYDHEEGGWCDSVTVTPGRDGATKPYGDTYGTYVRSFTGWTSNEDPDYDLALITINSEIGDTTGWFGMKTADKSSSIYTGMLNTAGYPGENIDDGTHMWYTNGYGQSTTEQLHYYDLDSEGGQSGSPVWQKTGSERYILTVHTHGSNPYNFGTRLNNQKYYSILNWIQADDTSEELPDLVPRGMNYMGFDKDFITAGGTLEMWADIANYGLKSSEEFRIDFYLTNDTTLTFKDYHLGHKNVTSLDKDSYIRVFNEVSVPDNITEGSYYLGVFIDSTEIITEFNETNNNITYLYSQITVDNTAPDSPSVSESTGIKSNASWVNTPAILEFNLSSTEDTIGYYYYWGKVSNSTDLTYLSTDSLSMMVNGSGIHYLRIQSVDHVGLRSRLETFFIYCFDEDRPSNPTQCEELSGKVKNGEVQWEITEPTFLWSEVEDKHSGIKGYYIYWGVNSSGTSLEFQNETSYSAAPVTESDYYYLRVLTVDEAGNEANTWKTLFTFCYEKNIFSNPLFILGAIAGVIGIAGALFFRKRKHLRAENLSDWVFKDFSVDNTEDDEKDVNDDDFEWSKD